MPWLVSQRLTGPSDGCLANISPSSRAKLPCGLADSPQLPQLTGMCTANTGKPKGRQSGQLGERGPKIASPLHFLYWFGGLPDDFVTGLGQTCQRPWANTLRTECALQPNFEESICCACSAVSDRLLLLAVSASQTAAGRL